MPVMMLLCYAGYAGRHCGLRFGLHWTVIPLHHSRIPNGIPLHPCHIHIATVIPAILTKQLW